MASEVLDLRKELRHLYRAPTGSCELVEVPELKYLMVDGRGDPATAAPFQDAMQALYSVAYTAKFTSKALGRDFKVMPVEGLWWSEDPQAFATDGRDAWCWTVMVMVPDFIDPAFVDECASKVAAKKEVPALDLLRLESYTEGSAVQTMHLGPYDTEGPTIAMLHKYMEDEGLTFAGKHHEIYLSDPRRTAPERIKTIIRQAVKKA
jgi:hypothetical protein